MQLEHILRCSIPPNCVFGYLTTELTIGLHLEKRNMVDVTLRAFNRPKKGLARVEVILNYPLNGKTPASPEVIHFLAAEMGGDYSISMDYLGPIMNGQFHSIDREEQIAAERYKKKDFYQELFQLVGVDYEENDEKLFLLQKQPHLHLTPDQVSAAYALVSKERLVSGISNSSQRRRFSLYQFTPFHSLEDNSKPKQFETSLHLSVGESVGSDVLHHEEIEHVEKVINRLGYHFRSINLYDGFWSFLRKMHDEETLNHFGEHFVSDAPIMPKSWRLLQGGISFE